MSDLLLEPACAILAALDRGDLSAVELTTATLARIRSLNPQLNAVVAIDERGALAQAAASDRRRRAGERRALEGLPVTVKDAFDVAGLVSTAGARSFRDRVPERDAAVVARLRAAGCVIIGKTNVPAYSGDFQTYNAIYGTTNNPWDLASSPGGSSGGAAAAVATGMSAFEIGSDLAGSIRWPAHACGIFGLKPTWGLVSVRGHVPPPPGIVADPDILVAGPLARSAADLDLVLSVIAGPPDLGGVAPRLDPPRCAGPAGLRLALWLDEAFAPVDRDVSDAVRRAADLLVSLGAVVDESARPAFRFEEAFEVFSLIDHAMVAAALPPELRDRLAAEGATFPAGDLSHRALQTRAARLGAEEWHGLKRRQAAIKRAWADFFTRFDAVLMPPAPVPAIRHDHDPDLHARRLIVNGLERPYFDFMLWSSLAGVAHLPAAVAPVGRTTSGLPVGVQIVAAEGADRTAIGVARLLDAAGCEARPPQIVLMVH